ncbi:ribosomal protein L1-like protein [Gloeopeniophorella convolvens]|nr:ribosomal protein L1-like protein [Gloeopeniophorella convolvens]
MSFLQLAAARQTAALARLPHASLLPFRSFSASHVALARQTKKAAPARKPKSKKKGKVSIYDAEKMTLTDAINVLRAVEVGSPNATYELTVKTAMPRGSTIPKGRISLPRNPKKAGADVVGGPELVEAVASGRVQATLFLSTPSLIKSISSRLGRILGPRGLMPSERRGTVTEDVAGYIRRLQGTREWKGDKRGTIRTPIAKLDYPVEDVVKNIRHFVSIVKRATGNQPQSTDKDQNTKPVNAITKVVLSSRQGPGIQISDL